MPTHLVNHIHRPALRSDDTLHVVGVLFNPMRYQSRYRIFREWLARMKATPNVKVYVVEVAFGDRQHECTDHDDPTHLQLRTNQALFNKESIINIGEKYLFPNGWRYMCWSDADVFWPDEDWAKKTLHQLQHHPVVQPWRDCLDLGFHGQVLQHFQSFAYVQSLGVPMQTHPSQPYKYAHSGFAWACRRDWWERVEKLMDFPILGSADHHMAWAMIGRVHDSVHGKMHDNFKMLAKDWQRRAHRATYELGGLGYVNTRIEHRFHGKKANRKYRERWQIFIDHGFDPLTDILYDPQGLICLHGKPRLLKACQDYLSQRNEDDVTDV